MERIDPKNNSKDSNERFWQKHYKHYDFFQNQLDWYNDTIVFHMKNMENRKKILDTGAGSGNLTIRLAWDWEVVAIDSESYSLELLQEKITKENKKVKIVGGDVQKMPFQDNSFDGITSMFLVPFVESNEAYFKEVFRVLQHDGVFSASIWAPIQDSETNWELRMAVEEKFKAQGILPKYKEERDELLCTSKINAKDIDFKEISDDKIKITLDNIGFTDIRFYDDVAYKQYAYFVTAKKPSYK